MKLSRCEKNILTTAMELWYIEYIGKELDQYAKKLRIDTYLKLIKNIEYLEINKK